MHLFHIHWQMAARFRTPTLKPRRNHPSGKIWALKFQTEIKDLHGIRNQENIGWIQGWEQTHKSTAGKNWELLPRRNSPAWCCRGKALLEPESQLPWAFHECSSLSSPISFRKRDVALAFPLPESNPFGLVINTNVSRRLVMLRRRRSQGH